MTPAFHLVARETGTDYWIYVYAPDPATDRGPWPAVLFMDGDDQFRFAVKAYQTLRASRAVPALLLVGVGYGASYGKPVNRRGRDYTPVAHSDEPTSGGADAFLAFLCHTLWPELETRYPVHATERGIAGHSLGSLLVLHALFQRRPFFNRHLASAPSIWWADRAILQQAETLRTRVATLPARLYLAAGTDESESMLGDLALLETQLANRGFAGLEVASERFAGRTHTNALAVTFPAGLRRLFAPAF